MRIEKLYIGTRAEITELVTKKHTEITGAPFSVAEQLDVIESKVHKFGLVFMKPVKGPYQIDKWWVHLREDDEFPIPAPQFKSSHD